MIWVLVIGAIWLLLAAAVALVVARSIRLADTRAAHAPGDEAPEPNIVIDPAPTEPDAQVVLPFPTPAPEAEKEPGNGEDRTATGPPPLRPTAPGARPPELGTPSSPAERSHAGRRFGIG